MQIISTNKAPGAIGPYSQAIVINGMVYTSGQIPCDPDLGAVTGTNVEEQTERVMQNLKAVLEAAGASLTTVVKTTCFLASMDDFQKFNEVYANYMVNKPARSCIAAKTLPKNVLVEVEAIAQVQ